MRTRSLLLCLMLVYYDTASVMTTQTVDDRVQVDWIVADAPPSGWTVGDPILVRLTATYPAGYELNLPELPSLWGPFEVREQKLYNPVTTATGKSSSVREATLVPWAPGEYQTPPYTVQYQSINDHVEQVAAPPITITVVSVLQAGDGEKRDLKPQASLRAPPVWPWTLAGSILILLVGLAGWFALIRLRHQASSVSTPGSPAERLPPYLVAYRELDRIATLGLPSRGQVQRHYTLIADCLRVYIQGRFGIPAKDQTTTELADALRESGPIRDRADLIVHLLNEADLVKFAGYRPSEENVATALSRARHIVEVTKLVVESNTGPSLAPGER